MNDRRVTHAPIVVERPIQAVPAGTVAPSYQCSPSFEPSAAAVIIAGIPIATVASAIARASIMTIPLDSTSSSRSDRVSLGNRFPINIYRTSASGVFHHKGFGVVTCGNNRASVSQFLTGIGRGRPCQVAIGVAGFYLSQAMNTEKTNRESTPPAITSFSPARSGASSLRKCSPIGWPLTIVPRVLRRSCT
jgi:hypothetical protein